MSTSCKYRQTLPHLCYINIFTAAILYCLILNFQNYLRSPLKHHRKGQVQIDCSRLYQLTKPDSKCFRCRRHPRDLCA